jgi:hypothetical protein
MSHKIIRTASKITETDSLTLKNTIEKLLGVPRPSFETREELESATAAAIAAAERASMLLGIGSGAKMCLTSQEREAYPGRHSESEVAGPLWLRLRASLVKLELPPIMPAKPLRSEPGRRVRAAAYTPGDLTLRARLRPGSSRAAVAQFVEDCAAQGRPATKSEIAERFDFLGPRELSNVLSKLVVNGHISPVVAEKAEK